MKDIIELHTTRLKLRQWQTSDYPAFAKMNADREVMAYFPKLLTEPESNAMADALSQLIEERGWGLWALEEKETGTFLGFTGLHKAPANLPCSPAVEIGWRLAREAWGKGYATEAAKAVLRFAFTELQLDAVVSFTSVGNIKSQAVMRRIGLADAGNNFMHPNIPESSPLQEHVLYTINRTQWFETDL